MQWAYDSVLHSVLVLILTCSTHCSYQLSLYGPPLLLFFTHSVLCSSNELFFWIISYLKMTHLNFLTEIDYGTLLERDLIQ